MAFCAFCIRTNVHAAKNMRVNPVFGEKNTFFVVILYENSFFVNGQTFPFVGNEAVAAWYTPDQGAWHAVIGKQKRGKSSGRKTARKTEG